MHVKKVLQKSGYFTRYVISQYVTTVHTST